MSKIKLFTCYGSDLFQVIYYHFICNDIKMVNRTSYYQKSISLISLLIVLISLYSVGIVISLLNKIVHIFTLSWILLLMLLFLYDFYDIIMWPFYLFYVLTCDLFPDVKWQFIAEISSRWSSRVFFFLCFWIYFVYMV